MRTKSSIRNLTAAFLGQLLGIAISFISRKIFIGVLDEEYLGINGLFTNILSMLSIMELGVGPAIVFCLYKPLAEDNQAQILALMKLFRRLYCLIGCGILAAGIGISFFLPVFFEQTSGTAAAGGGAGGCHALPLLRELPALGGLCGRPPGHGAVAAGG